MCAAVCAVPLAGLVICLRVYICACMHVHKCMYVIYTYVCIHVRSIYMYNICIHIYIYNVHHIYVCMLYVPFPISREVTCVCVHVYMCVCTPQIFELNIHICMHLCALCALLPILGEGTCVSAYIYV